MSISQASEQFPGGNPEEASSGMVNDTCANDRSEEPSEASPATTEDPTMQLLESEWAIYQDPTMHRHVWGQE